MARMTSVITTEMAAAYPIWKLPKPCSTIRIDSERVASARSALRQDDDGFVDLRAPIEA